MSPESFPEVRSEVRSNSASADKRRQTVKFDLPSSASEPARHEQQPARHEGLRRQRTWASGSSATPTDDAKGGTGLRRTLRPLSVATSELDDASPRRRLPRQRSRKTRFDSLEESSRGSFVPRSPGSPRSPRSETSEHESSTASKFSPEEPSSRGASFRERSVGAREAPNGSAAGNEGSPSAFVGATPRPRRGFYQAIESSFRIGRGARWTLRGRKTSLDGQDAV